MKKIVLHIFGLALFISAKAEFGVWASAVYLNVNGTAQFYNNQPLSPDPNAIGAINFSGSLGNFGINSGLLKIGGAEIKTFKNNNGNVCGGTLFYTVYQQGNRPGSPVFSQINLGFFCNCSGGNFNSCGGGGCTDGSDQKWQNVSQNIDLTTMAAGNYTLEIYYSISGHPTNNGACDQTRFDNNGNNPTNYTANFTLLTVAASYFTGISSSVYGNNIKVRWVTQNDADVDHYELQKSQNGVNYNTIASISANRTAGTSQYFIVDANPYIGSNYYRVKMVNINGSVVLSKTIREYFGTVNNSIFVYPNPSANELTIRLAGVAKGNYRLSVFNNNSQRIAAIAILHDGTDRTIKMNLPFVLAKGIYRLLLIDKTQFYKQSFLIK